MYAKPTQLYDNIENGRNEMCIMCNSIQFNSIDKMCSEVSLTFHTRET